MRAAEQFAWHARCHPRSISIGGRGRRALKRGALAWTAGRAQSRPLLNGAFDRGGGPLVRRRRAKRAHGVAEAVGSDAVKASLARRRNGHDDAPRARAQTPLAKHKCETERARPSPGGDQRTAPEAVARQAEQPLVAPPRAFSRRARSPSWRTRSRQIRHQWQWSARGRHHAWGDGPRSGAMHGKKPAASGGQRCKQGEQAELQSRHFSLTERKALGSMG